MISNHGVRGRKVGVGAVEKLVGTKTMAWRREQIFLFGHSEDLNPARIRILPQGSFVPGILNNVQQTRQSVTRLTIRTAIVICVVSSLPDCTSITRQFVCDGSQVMITPCAHHITLDHCQPSGAHRYILHIYKWYTLLLG